MRAELTRFRWDAEATHGLCKSFVKRFGYCRGHGSGEVGAASLPAVSIERELAYDERGAFDVKERKIELARLIGEDAQLYALLCELNRVRLGVLRAHAQEYHEAAA